MNTANNLIVFIILVVILYSGVNAQTYTLRFDGINDYIDIGTQTMDNVRSIEMWFKPALDIDSTILKPMTLLARENQGTMNENEFDLAFVPFDWPGSGSLRFKFSYNMSSEYTIYSDTVIWEANRWYHVAITLDFIEGMMMFINGYKQSDYYPLYDAIPALNKMTTIGRWGEIDDRFFLGRIDDVRLSYNSIYLSNFTPPCPDIPLGENTAALYHFNEGSGFTAWDASPNGFDGLIVGPIHILDSICVNAGVEDFLEVEDLNIYPHPIYNISKIELPVQISGNMQLNIYDSYGKIVHNTDHSSCKEITLNKGDLKPGIYILELINNNRTVDRKKIIIQ